MVHLYIQPPRCQHFRLPVNVGSTKTHCFITDLSTRSFKALFTAGCYFVFTPLHVTYASATSTLVTHLLPFPNILEKFYHEFHQYLKILCSIFSDRNRRFRNQLTRKAIPNSVKRYDRGKEHPNTISPCCPRGLKNNQVRNNRHKIWNGVLLERERRLPNLAEFIHPRPVWTTTVGFVFARQAFQNSQRQLPPV